MKIKGRNNQSQHVTKPKKAFESTTVIETSNE